MASFPRQCSPLFLFPFCLLTARDTSSSTWPIRLTVHCIFVHTIRFFPYVETRVHDYIWLVIIEAHGRASVVRIPRKIMQLVSIFSFGTAIRYSSGMKIREIEIVLNEFEVATYRYKRHVRERNKRTVACIRKRNAYSLIGQLRSTFYVYSHSSLIS